MPPQDLKMAATSSRTDSAAAAGSSSGTPRAVPLGSEAHVKVSTSLRLKTFDWIGAFLSTGGLVMLTFALADAETAPRGWTTSYVLALLPTSIALLVAFSFWEQFLERKQRTYEMGASSALRFNRAATRPCSRRLPQRPFCPLRSGAHPASQLLSSQSSSHGSASTSCRT